MSNCINILGPRCVGKTSLLQFLKYGHLPKQQYPTMSADYYLYDFEIDGNKMVCELRDNPGQQRYRYILWSSLRNFNAFILMFDVSSSDSFERVKQWLTQLRENLSSQQNILYVIGNKQDLPRQLDRDYIQNYWEEQKIDYVQISVKKGENTKKIVDQVLRQMWFQIEYRKKLKQEKKEIFKLQPKREQKKNTKKKCC